MLGLVLPLLYTPSASSGRSLAMRQALGAIKHESRARASFEIKTLMPQSAGIRLADEIRSQRRRRCSMLL